MEKMEKIVDIAKNLGLRESDIVRYGDYIAKIENCPIDKKGKLVLVTAINPTKFGEGKTTVSIALADAMRMIGLSCTLALREPSLGPVFGVKGGATGGGEAVILPQEEINLHFTGDFHAIESANNLLCAMIDNHLYFGNQLNIDPEKILFHRCMDMNDRALRMIEISQESLKNNVARKEEFTITAASEIMSILCLSKDIKDLKRRLKKIMIAFDKTGNPVYAGDLKAENAMTLLLKDALKPNLVQTKCGTPAIVHGGPFANISFGCNSILATKYALSLSDIAITEAGFGADLGGEKFLDLKCRLNHLSPNAVVLVATMRALIEHGQGKNKYEMLKVGLKNLKRHIENLRNIFNRQVIVAINVFKGDSEKGLKQIEQFCQSLSCESARVYPFTQGGEGALQLAKKVYTLLQKPNKKLSFAYNLNDDIKTKISNLCQKVYGAKGVVYKDGLKEKIALLERQGKNFPIVMAKTQYTFSSDEKDRFSENFDFYIQDVEIKNGARFLLVKAGKIALMPGLPKVPNACKMKI